MRETSSPGILPRFRALIFDLDGLVVDSEPTYVAAWRAAAAELGVALEPEFCEGLFGQHADDVERALRARLGSDYRRDRFFPSAEWHWQRHLAQHGMARMPGVAEVLHFCRRRRLPHALATNSDRPFAEICLRAADLDRDFPIVVTRDQVRHGKPAPDLFEEAARRLDASPGECLVLEDSEPGLIAARAAGAASILIQRHAARRNRLAHLASLALPSLAELTGLLEASGSPPDDRPTAGSAQR